MGCSHRQKPGQDCRISLLDTITQRCARLLWEGYKAAGGKEVVQLDSALAADAVMPAGTARISRVHTPARIRARGGSREARAGEKNRGSHILQDQRSWFYVAAGGGLPP